MGDEYTEYEVTVQVRTTVSRLVEARDPGVAMEKVAAWLDEEGYETIAFSIEEKEAR
ncbi:MAG: hypothetical protein AAFR65_10415 [Pseudomonadota bacterium]